MATWHCTDHAPPCGANRDCTGCPWYPGWAHAMQCCGSCATWQPGIRLTCSSLLLAYRAYPTWAPSCAMAQRLWLAAAGEVRMHYFRTNPRQLKPVKCKFRCPCTVLSAPFCCPCSHSSPMLTWVLKQRSRLPTRSCPLCWYGGGYLWFARQHYIISAGDACMRCRFMSNGHARVQSHHLQRQFNLLNLGPGLCSETACSQQNCSSACL
jgi:hypothetical protein